MSFSANSLTFPATTVGSSSSSQTITLTNSGTASMSVSVSASGDFTQTNKCGTSSLAAGKICTITVTFKPTATGTRTGAVNVTSTQASNSPQAVQLSGTGQ
ncbi:MAG: choice-of-anchor D domain-containing protein [Candidatus Acidiferrales bacterium]